MNKASYYFYRCYKILGQKASQCEINRGTELVRGDSQENVFPVFFHELQQEGQICG